MPTVVIQNDQIIRALSAILDPACDPARAAGFADYYSVDMPEFPEWCAEMRAKYPAIAPSTVVLANNQQEFDAALADADAVVIEDFAFGAEQLDAAPNLKIVHNFRTDMRNIDEAACAARGVAVKPFNRRVNVAVAEHAFAMTMSLAKKMSETNKLLTIEALQAEGWPAKTYDRTHTANSNWARVSGIKNLFGSTIGIVGLGSIGRCVARWANAFGMTVLYHQRNQLDAALEAEFNARFVSLNDLFAQSDFVSVHVPLSASTKGLIGTEQFATMKPGTIVVNIARADIIDRAALLDVLESGKIGGLGMDVHYQEPGDPDDPMLAFKNVILSPHIAIGTRVNGADDMEELIANLAAVMPR
jgi:phosphoglycerate dehydrogenase-like enzyme